VLLKKYFSGCFCLFPMPEGGGSRVSALSDPVSGKPAAGALRAGKPGGRPSGSAAPRRKKYRTRRERLPDFTAQGRSLPVVTIC